MVTNCTKYVIKCSMKVSGDGNSTTVTSVPRGEEERFGALVAERGFRMLQEFDLEEIRRDEGTVKPLRAPTVINVSEFDRPLHSIIIMEIPEFTYLTSAFSRYYGMMKVQRVHWKSGFVHQKRK